MSSLPARTGRYRQRYKDHLRLVSGLECFYFFCRPHDLHMLTFFGANIRCIPYRLGKNFTCCYNNPEKTLLVLMISSPDRDDLVFPKGGWENDETIDEAARREALEEAGVRGILSENPLGVWEFRSKSKQNSSSLEGGCRGYMFALNVTEELDSWPEQASHDRKWLTAEEAFKFCRYDWMRDALRRFLKTLSEESSLKMIGESKEKHVIRPVADASEVRQMSSPGYFGNPSGIQHLENSCCNCIVQG